MKRSNDRNDRIPRNRSTWVNLVNSVNAVNSVNSVKSVKSVSRHPKPKERGLRGLQLEIAQSQSQRQRQIQTETKLYEVKTPYKHQPSAKCTVHSAYCSAPTKLKPSKYRSIEAIIVKRRALTQTNVTQACLVAIHVLKPGPRSNSSRGASCMATSCKA